MAPQSPALGGLAQRLGPGRNKKAKPQGGQSCSPRSCSVRLKPKMVQSANASKNEFFIYKRKYIYVEYWNNWSSSIMVNWDSYWYGCYHIGRNFFLWFLCWFRIITLNRAPFGAQPSPKAKPKSKFLSAQASATTSCQNHLADS